MNTLKIAENYNKIAETWDKEMTQSSYGLSMVEKAILLSNSPKSILDVGCGSGGRVIERLQQLDAAITGVDISSQMINIAKKKHSNIKFINADITNWETDDTFDFIIAWDSIFHLQLNQHKPVLTKLSNMLNKGGVFIYTLGKDQGEMSDIWHNMEFYYSSLGIEQNLKIMMENNCRCVHLEFDQYPLDHVTVVFKKM